MLEKERSFRVVDRFDVASRPTGGQ